jgi:hypothetical protein
MRSLLWSAGARSRSKSTCVIQRIAGRCSGGRGWHGENLGLNRSYRPGGSFLLCCAKRCVEGCRRRLPSQPRSGVIIKPGARVFDRPVRCETSVRVTSDCALTTLMISGRSSGSFGQGPDHRHEAASQAEKPKTKAVIAKPFVHRVPALLPARQAENKKPRLTPRSAMMTGPPTARAVCLMWLRAKGRCERSGTGPILA